MSQEVRAFHKSTAKSGEVLFLYNHMALMGIK